jgi:hypothetical protein
MAKGKTKGSNKAARLAQAAAKGSPTGGDNPYGSKAGNPTTVRTKK